MPFKWKVPSLKSRWWVRLCYPGLLFLSYIFLDTGHWEFENARRYWSKWSQNLEYKHINGWKEKRNDTWEDVSRSSLPERINRETTRVYAPDVLSTLNNPSNPGDTYIYLAGIYGYFYVLSDNEVVYKYGWDEKISPSENFLGYPWHIIKWNSNHNLEIHVHSKSNLIGPFGDAIIGDLSSLFWYIFTQSWERIILGVFFILLGLFSLIFVFDRSARTSFLLFGMISLNMGVYTITRSPGRLFYGDNHIIWTWLNLMSVYSLVPSLYSFLNRLFPWQKLPVLLWASRIQWSFWFIAMVISWNGIESLMSTLPFFQYLVWLTGLAVIVQIPYITWKERKKNQLILLSGILLFFLFGFQESLVAMGFVVFQYTSIYWGMLFLILSFAFALVQKFIDMNIQLDKSNQNLKKLLAIQEELESAKNIQLSLIPRNIPDQDNYRVLGHYTPMDKVGGDFYDFFMTDKGKLGVFLCDVSGHGLSTAILASMVKVALSQLSDHKENPAILMRELNKVLVGKCGKQFITAVYLHLNWNTMKYKISQAAHPHIIHFSVKDRMIHHRRTRGRVLGVWEDLEYKEGEFSFSEGDLFLLFSDGILEVGDNFDHFPEDEYLDAIIEDIYDSIHKENQDHKKNHLVEMESRILDYISEWRGSREFEDDISFVGVQAISHNHKT